MRYDSELTSFVIKLMDEKIDSDDYHVDWKFGFLMALYCQKFIMNSGKQLDTVKRLDPWKYQAECEEIYDYFSGMNCIAEKDLDDVMEDFITHWPKLEHRDPLLPAFEKAKSELRHLGRETRRARSEADDKLVQRMCEIISEEIGVFYIPTRALGKLLGRNRQYAANKINRLVNEKLLIEVKKGTNKSSPHYRYVPLNNDNDENECPF